MKNSDFTSHTFRVLESLFVFLTYLLLKEPDLLKSNGDDRDRTDNLRLARAALSQLSYVPEPTKVRAFANLLMGPGRLELPTSRLSGVRSSQLSYEPL